ncbi:MULTISPECIES: LAETG motif-containing sortase-dependent surface protein [Streptomyces]|uniref:LAETG motif-containing sortase-dependent surface protein n=2 Tax=Streptomyces TaxID=1883 RepID=A0ABV9J7R8_9ACTN
MSLSRRTAARPVRVLGVIAASAALAFSASGTALACEIGDFSAAAACDGAKGVITVKDTDVTGVPAVISVFLENNGADLRKVGEETVEGTKDGAVVTFSEDWEPNAVYRIHITATKGKKTLVDADIEPNLTTPSAACTTDVETVTPSAPASDSQTPTDDASTPSDESTSPAPTSTSDDSGSDSTPAPASSDNAPSPAVQESNLAETGAGSSTGLIAGLAALLVVIGGGAVFFGMRRRGSSNR